MQRSHRYHIHASGCFTLVLLLLPILAAFALGYLTSYLIH